jgi:hypothetical protein
MLAWLGLVTYLVHTYSKNYDLILILIPLILWMCTKASHRSFATWFFWIGSLIIFWLAFFTNKQFLNPVIIMELPFFVYLAWLCWFFIDLYRKNKPQSGFQNLLRPAIH